MNTQRWFNLFIVVALVVALAITVREVAATSTVISRADSVSSPVLACSSLPARSSIHTEYVEEARMWVIRSENGPTGVDDGLKTLLSAYETCSK